MQTNTSSLQLYTQDLTLSFFLLSKPPFSFHMFCILLIYYASLHSFKDLFYIGFSFLYIVFLFICFLNFSGM